jgi:maestro heat-like repeat-containing protein family member 1
LPHLKEVLIKTLPLLALLKHDNLRWVFAAGLGRFAEAIVIATNDEKNPSLIPVSEFSGSINTALRHIMSEWLLQMKSNVRNKK